ncbi:MAG: UDP-N-acetylmuramoyl-L-alanine--D-glutamate ligase [Flavobacteriales bacterium]|nr:UDP-N-acetylmuramoyl-L-alanine--D-glutamate ligase [Flavobacteriales bacterium]MCB9196894.1 UDP-N-acetylmuramoyl-L-alanine--D-glutamate ligase [Flavobacteriales bacterium]
MKVQRIAILGGGESGVGAAILAKKEGFDVWLSDLGKLKDKHKEVLLNNEIKWEEGRHSEEEIFKAVEVIKSPGIPDKAPLIVALKERGIPVISEIEFAGRYVKPGAKLICITGSNGKTTTTLMTHHILKKAGLNVAVGGNVGKSFAGLVAEGNYDYYVLELSSFQLDGMYQFKADIAILLNITPDHLDRYDYDMQKYIDSKYRIIQNQGPDDVFIYNYDDPIIQTENNKRNFKQRTYAFSHEVELKEGAWVTTNKQIQTNINNQQTKMSIHELAQQGRHNAYNSMASSIASRVLEIRKEIIRESLSDFQNVEHRLEFVASVHGIDFINDSKATNVNSTWYALESMQKPTIWIAGGVDKGNDYTMLEALVKEKVEGIVCLGKDNSKLHKAFEGLVENIWDASTADEAVGLSYRLAKKGYNVLLSPACASFDLFENYEERGMQFKRAVRSL